MDGGLHVEKVAYCDIFLAEFTEGAGLLLLIQLRASPPLKEKCNNFVSRSCKSVISAIVTLYRTAASTWLGLVSRPP